MNHLGSSDRLKSQGKEWVEDYQRGYLLKIDHKPEHLTARGMGHLNRLWEKLRPEILRRFPDDDVPESVPKDIQKWAILPDWLELMEKHPHKFKNVFDWLDKAIPRSGWSFRGVATVKRRPELKEARRRQGGTGVNMPRPAFTFHGERLPYTGAQQFARRLVNEAITRGLYTDADIQELDRESLDSWNSVQGGQCSTYVIAEASTLFHGTTPQQDSHAPIPHDIAQKAWEMMMEQQFPAFYQQPTHYLEPKNLCVTVGDQRGIFLGNRQGAAGYPYTNMQRSEVAEAVGRDSVDGVRISKGLVLQHALRVGFDWIQAGMPMRGELYEAVSQPATIAYRGDREVDITTRKWASRGPDQRYNSTAEQLAAIFPSRSVIIVPTVLVLLQSMWAQPMGAYVNDAATPGYDWVDPYHTSVRLDEIRTGDLSQADTRGPSASVGADASGWDRDVTGQDHALATATYLSLFPEEVELVYIDAPLPVDVEDSFMARLKADQSGGKVSQLELTGVDEAGGEHIVQATSQNVKFNFHELICKVMTMVNDSPVCWADYEVDAPGILQQVPNIGYGPTRRIVSNGGQRSGDAITGLQNSTINLVLSIAASLMSFDPSLTKMVARRASRLDTGPLIKHYVADDFARGDDRATLIVLPEGGVPSEAIANGLAALGRRANAKKQEASDVPGTPVFGFANIHVTQTYMGKLIGRSFKRFHIQESPGIPIETLDMLRQEGNDTGFEDSLVVTTLTARARLAPLHGYPFLSLHPSAKLLTEYGINNDKYRLSYIVPAAVLQDGSLSEEALLATQRAVDKEAAVQARLQARRSNTAIDLDNLEEVWKDNSIHATVEEVAFSKDYRPRFKQPKVDNPALFQEAVTNGTPLNL